MFTVASVNSWIPRLTSYATCDTTFMAGHRSLYSRLLVAACSSLVQALALPPFGISNGFRSAMYRNPVRVLAQLLSADSSPMFFHSLMSKLVEIPSSAFK